MQMLYNCCNCQDGAEAVVESCERGVEYDETPFVSLGHTKVLVEDDEPTHKPEETHQSVTPGTCLEHEDLAVITLNVKHSERIHSVSTCSDIDSLASPPSLHPPSTAPSSDSDLRVWSVAVQKVPGESLGLILDTLDNKALLVCDVLSGPFQRYNESLGHDFDHRVQRGDSVVAVSGTSGDSKALISALQAIDKQSPQATTEQAETHSITLQMTLVRPRSVRIEIPKAYSPVGLELAHTGGAGGLLVKSISSGMVKDWNMARSSKGIRRMDRILEVNGESSSPESLLREIKVAASTGRKLEMHVMRYPGWAQVVAKMYEDAAEQLEEKML